MIKVILINKRESPVIAITIAEDLLCHGVDEDRAADEAWNRRNCKKCIASAASRD